MSKNKIAAALEYDPNDQSAPVLAAFGQGAVAERIIDTARESDIPVVEDASLSMLLKQISIGDEIPEELYEVVAQVLVFIGEAERKVNKQKK